MQLWRENEIINAEVLPVAPLAPVAPIIREEVEEEEEDDIDMGNLFGGDESDY